MKIVLETISRTTKIDVVPPCFTDNDPPQHAITGAPVDAYLSTSQLRGHVLQDPTCPITPTGTLCKASSGYSPHHSFFQIYHAIIQGRYPICQPLNSSLSVY